MALHRANREQLARYPNVSFRDVQVDAIVGERGAFSIRLPDESIAARRIVLCVGMIDELLLIDGFSELWGSAIFQCPYCHGWEIRDRVWGYFASRLDQLHFALLLAGWTDQLVVFWNGDAKLPSDQLEELRSANVRVETTPVVRFVARGSELERVEMRDGRSVACDAIFVHPPQRQVKLVESLGVTLNDGGYIWVDDTTRQTSIKGIYAAGDATTPRQAAILAAASGTYAALALNHELTRESALSKSA